MPDDEITITDASKSQLNQILKTENACFDKPWSQKSLEQEFEHQDSFIKTAYNKSRICGFIVYRLFLGEIQIFKICCLKEYQNQGIATRLLNSAFNTCKQKAELAVLEVSSSNDKALSFYKKHGFIISGKRTNYYGQGKHALNMIKDLAGGLK